MHLATAKSSVYTKKVPSMMLVWHDDFFEAFFLFAVAGHLEAVDSC